MSLVNMLLVSSVDHPNTTCMVQVALNWLTAAHFHRSESWSLGSGSISVDSHGGLRYAHSCTLSTLCYLACYVPTHCLRTCIAVHSPYCAALHAMSLTRCLCAYRHHVFCDSRQKSGGNISYVRWLRPNQSVCLDHHLCYC